MRFRGWLLGVVALALLGAVGCASDEERFFQLQESLAYTVEKAGPDCDALALALAGWERRHGTALQVYERSLLAGNHEARAELVQRRAVRGRLVQAQTGSLRHCAEHPGVQRVMSRL